MVTTHDLQRLLEDAWDNAAETANTLRPELRANETAVGALLSQGQLANVSKNSASHSYAFGNNGALTTPDVAHAWRELINLFDACQTILVTAGDIVLGGEGDNDAAIYAEMTARLAIGPVYRTRQDISAMREVTA